MATLEKRLEPLLMEFKKDICDRAKEIDDEAELDWYDMSVGYFLAKGATLDDAFSLALYARYEKEYWN